MLATNLSSINIQAKKNNIQSGKCYENIYPAYWIVLALWL